MTDLAFLLSREPDAADRLEAGYYRWMRRNRVPQPVHIWWAQPADPDTGEQLDRSPRWHVRVGTDLVGDEGSPDLGDVWPVCKANPIDRAEYAYLMAQIRHARDHDPDSPFARRHGKIDLLSATIPTTGD